MLIGLILKLPACYLGNIRLVVSDKDGSGSIGPEEVLVEAAYYPFGLRLPGPYLHDSTVADYLYLYNGKELLSAHGLHLYHYGARLYDPGMSSWWQVDPLAEKYPSISPYAYVANNPIVFVDPDGRQI